jgi:DNA recombination protein RmuC
VLLEHWSKLGAALGRATEHFNGAVASLDARVLPAARKLEELGAGGRKEIVEPAQVEARPRVLLPSTEVDTQPTATEPA